MSDASSDGEPFLSPAEVAEALRRGDEVADAAFDQVYPSDVQEISDYQWTPLSVIDQVVELIEPDMRTRVLDVGSGVGKFCIAASLRAPGSYTGVERRVDRHRLAEAARDRFGAIGASFVLGDALALDWGGFDVLYLYNPFQELVARIFGAVGDTLAYGPEVQSQSVQAARRKLRELRVGARVVLFHGLGDEMPPEFEPASSMPCPAGQLEVWVRVAFAPASAPH